jgi:hypothetical protein
MFGPDGAESFSTVNEVVEFSQATLEASLFEIPAGYREVKDFASAFSSPNTDTTDNQQNNAPSPEANKPTPEPTKPSREPKKEDSPVKRGLKSLKPKW